jgi:hypothetical protein
MLEKTAQMTHSYEIIEDLRHLLSTILRPELLFRAAQKYPVCRIKRQ